MRVFHIHHCLEENDEKRMDVIIRSTCISSSPSHPSIPSIIIHAVAVSITNGRFARRWRSCFPKSSCPITPQDLHSVHTKQQGKPTAANRPEEPFLESQCLAISTRSTQATFFISCVRAVRPCVRRVKVFGASMFYL
jgi:hypothetical protein